MAHIRRPALGDSVHLGAIYDARADVFVPGVSLFDENTLADTCFEVLEKRSNKVQLVFDDSYRTKFEKMEVDGSLGGSILADMVRLQGSGLYLKDQRETNRELTASLIYTITTVDENLTLWSPTLRESINAETLGTEVGTHIVVGITWGASTVLTVTHGLTGCEDREVLEGRLKSSMSKMASHATTPDGNMNFSTDGVSTFESFKVKYHGDLCPGDMTLPLDFESAFKVFPSLQRSVKETKNGKGVPLFYSLMPIPIFAAIFAPGVKVASSVLTVTSEILEGYCEFFETLRSMQNTLRDHFMTIQKYSHLTTADHVRETEKLLAILQHWQSVVRKEYGTRLNNVRGGRGEMSDLLEPLNAAHSSGQIPTTADIENLTRNFQARLSFIESMKSNNVDLITMPEGANTLHAEVFGQPAEVYLFRFNSQTIVDRESWEGNTKLLLQLLDGRHGGKSYKVVVADYETDSNCNLVKSVIEHYKGGRLIVEDVLAERRYFENKGFMLYSKRKLLPRGDGRKPLQRRPIKAPCPNSLCNQSKELDWICQKCKTPLEYGFVDDYCYCKCEGRGHYSDYVFKCSDPQHSSSFMKYDRATFHQRLQALPPLDEVNILILGETGVGKSTFINSFINYLIHDSLEDACKSKLEYVVPCSFSMHYTNRDDPTGQFHHKHIKVGNDPFEHDGAQGKSATQRTRLYSVPLEGTTVRLIDTPGVGDTRGIDQDKENFKDILTALDMFDRLHGILILLKPNASRLNVMFRFCVKELLTHLHRDAAANMVFGFTGTRVSNYVPGDTLVPLKHLLAEHSDVGIELHKHTTYCFDSESFRYLAAKSNDVDMGNFDDFRRSWDHSKGETFRMIQHFKDLRPHAVKSTISLNRARELIQQLTKPMAELELCIKRTIQVAKEDLEDLQSKELAGNELRKRLTLQKEVLTVEPLQQPRTTCEDKDCVTYEMDDSKHITVYRAHCHTPCYLTGITAETTGAPGLLQCYAFNGRDTCRECGHHWRLHLHVYVEYGHTTIDVTDEEVVRQLNKNADDITVKRTAIQVKQRNIKELENESAQFREAAVRFGDFLRRNSITPYNDATIQYYDHLIKEEEGKAAIGGSRLRLETLQTSKAEYQSLIDVFEQNMRAAANGRGRLEKLDEAGVDSLVNHLYGLKEYGKHLRDAVQKSTMAYARTYRETPVSVPRAARARQNGSSRQSLAGGRRGHTILPIVNRSHRAQNNNVPGAWKDDYNDISEFIEPEHPTAISSDSADHDNRVYFQVNRWLRWPLWSRQ